MDRGCNAPPPKQYAVVLDGEQIIRCPRRPILDDPGTYSTVFWLYRQFKVGYLSESGGLNDQANSLVETFQVIDVAVADIQTHLEEQEAAKRRRSALRGMGAPRRR